MGAEDLGQLWRGDGRHRTKRLPAAPASELWAWESFPALGWEAGRWWRVYPGRRRAARLTAPPQSHSWAQHAAGKAFGSLIEKKGREY